MTTAAASISAMEIPFKLILELVACQAALIDDTADENELRFYFRAAVNKDQMASPEPVATLNGIFDEWFDEERGEELTHPEDMDRWAAEQFLMERFLEGQLRRIRKRLIKKGRYPSS